jgi:hypothetical protein
MALYFRGPFPEDNIFLRVMAIRSASAFLFLKYSYTLFLYTTPYLVYSILLSGVYIFALKTGRRIRVGKLPLHSDPRKRTELSLVVGEVHHPPKQVPSETPRWLVIPERRLFTGIAILGAIGSGKTASCMYPFAGQILAYRAQDPDRRIGGFILEVKGDFCGKVQEILARHGRAGDYVEISLESEYRYNPSSRLPCAARDKSDPQYYARLRVTKAQAELQRQSNAEQPREDQRTPSTILTGLLLDSDAEAVFGDASKSEMTFPLSLTATDSTGRVFVSMKLPQPTPAVADEGQAPS